MKDMLNMVQDTPLVNGITNSLILEHIILFSVSHKSITLRSFVQIHTQITTTKTTKSLQPKPQLTITKS